MGSKVMRQFIAVIGFCCFGFLQSAQAQTVTISGDFVLPSGAPAAGVSFEITAFTGFFPFFGDPAATVSFTTGETTNPYSITVDDAPTTEWGFRVQCSGDCSDYMDEVFYKVNGARMWSVDSFSLSRITTGGSNISGMDFDAPAASTISGDVSFPPGYPTQSGLELGIRIVDLGSAGFLETLGDLTLFPMSGLTGVGYSAKYLNFSDAEAVVEVACFIETNCRQRITPRPTAQIHH